MLPAVDTADGAAPLGLDFFVNDLVAGLSSAAGQSAGVSVTAGYRLDAALRRVLREDRSTATGAAVRRTVSHYGDDSDSPVAITEPDGSSTRHVEGVGGALSAVLSGTGPVNLQLANLHGDVLATVPATATGPAALRLSETTEYGQPRTRPAAGVPRDRYGYLGAHKRDASTPGGLTLMGARLYAPTLGRFLTVDPVEGGSSDDYDYVDADPINNLDLNVLAQMETGGGGGGGAFRLPGQRRGSARRARRLQLVAST